MPIQYLRSLTHHERDDRSNRRLGMILAFVAGAANAGGFLAVGQYTSHMSGIVSAMADTLALGQTFLFVAGLLSLLAFMAGSATSAILINWGRRSRLNSVYATPLLLEAALLLVFGLMGAKLEQHHLLVVPATVGLLCYVMGLQNAMITKVSKSEIRTTHVTGLVTDIGIELGKLFYWNVSTDAPGDPVYASRPKLRLLSALLGMFFIGGVIGALGFKHIGFIATVPLAAILAILALVPFLDDLKSGIWRRRQPRT